MFLSLSTPRPPRPLRPRSVGPAVVTALVIALGVVTVPSASMAAQDSLPPPSPRQMVSDVPSATPPTVTGGSVQTIAAVGGQMVIGGPITAVGGLPRTQVAAFDATTGQVTAGFAPIFDGDVASVLPGPTPGTVYVAGKFTTVNGVKAPRLALLDTVNGALVATFKAPSINGIVQDLYRVGDRLYLGGTFTKVAGQSRGGLASLQASTGRFDPFLDVSLTVRHNTGVSGAAVGAVGANAIDVSPDGRTMVVIGNFVKADTADRQQIALIDLTGATAEVRTDWQTTRYAAPCFYRAYDSYMRGVSFSPDGSYFVVAATGGPNPGTLCDTISRWETPAVGTSVQPTWVDNAGGDTLWATTVTDNAVYVGGHQRWLNNPQGGDFAASGAVARPGLAALDPLSGRPLAWNPGRNPRGIAVYAMLATGQGLWVGSNTDYIGNRKYKRPKLAFFPYAGGATLASTVTPTLPATVLVGGRDATSSSAVLYRVNAGGPTIPATDGGPAWADDQAASSVLRTTGSNVAGYPRLTTVSPTVPASTPLDVFSTERWDPAGGSEMQWDFPVPVGQQVQVRVYLADRCSCTAAAGQRRFDLTVDGVKKASQLDLSAQFGSNVGVMLATDVVSDGDVNLDFGHVVENPLVNAIEIVTPQTASPADPSLRARAFDGSTASAVTTVSSSVDWLGVRGAFTVGDQVFLGSTDGRLRRATLTGTTLSTPVVVQPYHDPAWMNVKTGSGTSVYDGHDPDFAAQLPQVGGMFYSGGRIYYTVNGSSALHWLWFSPDSGIVDGVSSTAPSSMSFAGVSGMFVNGNDLYTVSSTTGDLFRVAFAGGAVTGSPTLVDGPSTGGADWRGHALFLSPASS